MTWARRTARVAPARDCLGVESDRFLRDAARWVRPEQVADRSELDVLCVLRLLFRHPSLRAMGWFRLASWAKACGVPFVPGYLQRRMLRLYGLELVPGADVSGGLYIAHPSGCTLVAESIGQDVTVMANVTIGRLEREVWPRIGDGVFIGAGARILGPLTIGDHAVIGANAVVIRDLGPGTTAVGVPARAGTGGPDARSSEDSFDGTS